MTTKRPVKKEYEERLYYIISIKVHSDEKDKQELYSSLFNQIFNIDGFYAKIGNKLGLSLKKINNMELNKQQLGSVFNEIPYDSLEIFQGEFVKYKIENEGDKYFNTVSKELKPGDPSSPNKPNAVQIEFFFVPSIHRVLLPVSRNLNPNQVKDFFEQALMNIFEDKTFFNVDIAKSVEEVNKIYEFKELKKLALDISYTNDDIGGSAKKFFDTLMKEGNINKYKSVYEAENNESLNLDSNIIKGGIELSKENGEVKATGINSFGNKVVVDTKNKFEQVKLSIKKDLNPLISILKETYSKWRN
ncbi:DUF4747 family protein [Elizabethkingia meningoseptica]|uniref:DUF4747 family protein n=1 Tax=Elizabethkingia meningoseptica TaxID=238 RepID=UPI0023AFF695|nr:DUF4747 family protein [Elizabethkingia meningoseptica]MDE5490648.1 DUF4747 family protein [Elizabethkingia meningoseptica]